MKSKSVFHIEGVCKKKYPKLEVKEMKRFGIRKVGLLLVKSMLILSAFLLIPVQQASLASSNALGSNQRAELVEVVRVASNFLARSAWGSLEKWRGATLSEPFPLYDLDNHLSAYGFNVMGPNGLCGYIIVNLDKNDAPVPEFGDSPGLPFLNKYRELSAKVEREILPGQKLEGSGVIYLSCMTFLAEFLILQGDNSQNCLFFDLQTGEAIPALPQKVVWEDRINPALNHQAWEKLSNPSQQAVTLGFYEKVLTSVPAYIWYKGCAPTSGAMVMAYWQPRGYPGLPLGNPLIEELAVEMHTANNGGTFLWDIPVGIKQVAINHGYNNWNSWNDGKGRSYSTYAEFEAEINNNRPLVVSVEDSTVYGYHTMAGVGYRHNEYYDTLYIVVHDTRDSYYHYLDYNSSVVTTPIWTYVWPS